MRRGHEGGTSCNLTTVLIRRGHTQDTRTDLARGGHVPCKPRRVASEKPNAANALIWDPDLKNFQQMSVWVLAARSAALCWCGPGSPRQLRLPPGSKRTLHGVLGLDGHCGVLGTKELQGPAPSICPSSLSDIWPVIGSQEITGRQGDAARFSLPSSSLYLSCDHPTCRLNATPVHSPVRRVDEAGRGSCLLGRLWDSHSSGVHPETGACYERLLTDDRF